METSAALRIVAEVTALPPAALEALQPELGSLGAASIEAVYVVDANETISAGTPTTLPAVTEAPGAQRRVLELLDFLSKEFGEET